MKRIIYGALLTLTLLLSSFSFTFTSHAAALPQIFQASKHRVATNGINLTGDVSAVITPNGDLYTWGRNLWGEVGNGQTTNQKTPVKILSNVSNVKLGYHCAAITRNGALYVWGNNASGQVGNKSISDSINKPTLIMNDVADVALGDFHTIALTKNGSVYTWGGNVHGQLGNGTTDNSSEPTRIADGVKKIFAYHDRTMFLKEDGTLYAFGYNNCGQIGNGNKDDQINAKKILSDVKDAVMAEFNTAAIRNDGSLYIWGDNSCYQIGDGTKTSRIEPTRVMENVKSVNFGYGHTAALKTNGDLYLWGFGNFGQIGNGASAIYNPKQTKILSDISAVSLGDYHSVALSNTGTLYTWGNNEYGQLGSGDKTVRKSPYTAFTNVYNFKVGCDNTMTVTKDGNVYIWGKNYCGQIGDGTYYNRTEPYLLKNLSNIGSTDYIPPADQCADFTDCDKNAWYMKSVEYVVEKGLMKGVGEKLFAPLENTTRAQFVTVLYRLEKSPNASNVNVPFTDLNENWYIDAVKWAYNNGIVNGMTETKFNPTGNLTREQFATMLYRYTQHKGVPVNGTADLSKYKDVSKISLYAKTPMQWAVAKGYINGITATTLSPHTITNRAQMATILMRYIENK